MVLYFPGFGCNSANIKLNYVWEFMKWNWPLYHYTLCPLSFFLIIWIKWIFHSHFIKGIDVLLTNWGMLKREWNENFFFFYSHFILSHWTPKQENRLNIIWKSFSILSIPFLFSNFGKREINESVPCLIYVSKCLASSLY